MEMNRRQFVVLTSAVLVGCERDSDPIATTPESTTSPTPAPVEQQQERVSDAGPLDAFDSDRVYDSHREQGYFLIRRDDKLFAISSICTHKGCKVRAMQDQTFLCRCHGSIFDQNGKVTKGPAARNLPRFAIAVDEQRHVIVDLYQPLAKKPP
jgi:Rieske Fe-S protein